MDGFALALEGALEAGEATGERPLTLDEQEFRAFYARTARPLRSYLFFSTRDGDVADDLLQEAYLRFLRAGLPEMTDEHRKNYLFRIAANLVRDRFRRAPREPEPLPERPLESHDAETDDRIHLRTDLASTLGEMKPRERDLLWLAYVEGSKHSEIAEALGVKSQSVRAMLFRARRKLASLLREKGFAPVEFNGEARS